MEVFLTFSVNDDNSSVLNHVRDHQQHLNCLGFLQGFYN